MEPSPDAGDVLLEVVDAFEASGVEFMVVGAFAVMAHGRPRTTADIDISVHLRFEKRERLRDLLEGLGEGLEERVAPEWGKRVVVTHPSGLDIEVFFTAGHPFYAREFERKVKKPFRGRPVPFISPEDLILRKLVNTRKRRGPDWEDAVSVARVMGSQLDLAYLRENCAVHRVCGQVDRLARTADEGAA